MAARAPVQSKMDAMRVSVPLALRHALLPVCLLVVLSAGTLTASAAVDFVKDVQPVLTAQCLPCHSGANAQAGLKLHTRAELLEGGQGGPAVVPGNGASSLLIRKVRGEQGMRMPPSGAPLSPETIRIIQTWIDEGARYEGVLGTVDRLARMEPRLPALPPGEAAHPVDRFIEPLLRARGETMPAPVSDALFARRAFLDLHGLPPAPAALAAFVQATGADKRGALVDRLLADRQAYAEHWMSFWNDLLRNDEGVIYHGERKSITRWLQQSLEANKPYDAMVRELLHPAGNPDAEGYLTGVTWRGVVSASQSPPMQASQNAAQVFLGMNLKCAACHDSFVNRWKLADTFGLAAMFADEPLELVRCDVPTGAKAVARFPVKDLGVSFSASLDSRRQAAASWFTHPQNGRFARTIVNRYWKLLFGRGLVEPLDDMDAEPWSQDLLDWLASDFASHGYDLQRLLRLLMTSRAYQMPSVAPAAADGPYAFRGPELRRLTAEQFQDTLSAVTGDWRVNNPRADLFARYTREWRLKSDPLSRALGRPIRDQVYTERSTESSTLQALELTNGPLLSARLRSAARALLGMRQAAPENRFDSRMMRGGIAPVDAEIRGARELWLFVQDVDSYDPDRVRAGWANPRVLRNGKWQPLQAEVVPMAQKDGRVQAVHSPLGKLLRFPLHGEAERFQANAVIDEDCRQSDISPAVRFFVFTEQPDLDRLVRVQGSPPTTAPPFHTDAAGLIRYLYQGLLAREPESAELALAREILGATAPAPEGAEDLLWALLMSPEFQFIH